MLKGSSARREFVSRGHESSLSSPLKRWTDYTSRPPGAARPSSRGPSSRWRPGLPATPRADFTIETTAPAAAPLFRDPLDPGAPRS